MIPLVNSADHNDIISLGSALFAKAKLIFRERNTIFFWKL